MVDRKGVRQRQRVKSGILTPAEVARIKWCLKNGYTARMLKDLYDMSLWAIRAIERGDTWGWVEPDSGPEGAQGAGAGEALGLPPVTNMLSNAAADSQERMRRLMAEEQVRASGLGSADRLMAEAQARKDAKVESDRQLDSLTGDSSEKVETKD